MDRTEQLNHAEEFILNRIRHDAEDGLFLDAGMIESFNQLYDYCDANEYMEEALQSLVSLGAITPAEATAGLYSAASEAQFYRAAQFIQDLEERVADALYKRPIKCREE